MAATSPAEILIAALKDITRHQYGLQSIIEEYNDVNAFNYHAMEYHSGMVSSYRTIAQKALDAYRATTNEVHFSDQQLFDRLAHESWDLRSLNMPTGGDDYSINWVVMEHQGESDPDTEVGRAYSDDPREAIRDAIRNRALVTQSEGYSS